MKAAMTAAALLLSGPALADPAVDFAACLIGYSVLALEDQAGAKDAIAAPQAASLSCRLPNDPQDEIDVDAIGDHVKELVSAIAPALGE